MFGSEFGQIPSSYNKISWGIQGKIHFEYSVQLGYFKCTSLRTLEFSIRTPRVFRAPYRNTLGFLSPYSTSILHLSMLQNSWILQVYITYGVRLEYIRIQWRRDRLFVAGVSSRIYVLNEIKDFSYKWVWKLKFIMFPQLFSPWVGWTNHLFIGDGTIYRNLSLWNLTVYALRTCIFYGQKKLSRLIKDTLSDPYRLFVYALLIFGQSKREFN